MSRTITRTVESRAYDAQYDSTFTGPFHNVALDPRVASTLSSGAMVAGTGRFMYFRRPIMPRISAIAPQVLLAPTNADHQLTGTVEEAEPATKNAEIQTVRYLILRLKIIITLDVSRKRNSDCTICTRLFREGR